MPRGSKAAKLLKRVMVTISHQEGLLDRLPCEPQPRHQRYHRKALHSDHRNSLMKAAISTMTSSDDDDDDEMDGPVTISSEDEDGDGSRRCCFFFV